MNAKIAISVLIVLVALAAFPARAQVNYEAVRAVDPSAEIGFGSAARHETFAPPAPSPRVQLGQTDYVITGPLVQGLRRAPRVDPDTSPGRRFLNLPVVRMFVPQRLPTPPEEGTRYFAWGQSARPWAAIATGAPAGARWPEPITHEPRSALVSVSR
jgi:hypothetical protein